MALSKVVPAAAHCVIKVYLVCRGGSWLGRPFRKFGLSHAPMPVCTRSHPYIGQSLTKLLWKIVWSLVALW